MNRKLIVLIVGALFLIIGCSSKVNVSSPTDEMLRTADYGPQPTSVKQDLQDYFDRTLKDPHSVQLKPITEPEKGYLYIAKETPWKGEKRYVHLDYQPVFGWFSCVTYDAKNTYGGYTGWDQVVMFYVKGKDKPYIQKAKKIITFPSGLIMSSRHRPLDGEPKGKSIRERYWPVMVPQGCVR